MKRLLRCRHPWRLRRTIALALTGPLPHPEMISPALNGEYIWKCERCGHEETVKTLITDGTQ